MRRILVLTLCLWGCDSRALEISNFKSGIICPDTGGDIGKGWVCFETNEVPITGQGKCTYNGEARPCTWYGFQFDYKNATADDEFSCASSSNKAVFYGDPESSAKESADIQKWSFQIEPGAGRYYHPQYSIHSPQPTETEFSEETVCSINGREAFRIKFQFVYPSID